MKIYTKGGDKGTTSLYDGSRAPKSAINFQVIGEMDELSVRIGTLHASINGAHSAVVSTDFSVGGRPLSDLLRKIQCALQDLNSLFAVTRKTSKRLPSIDENTVHDLEKVIDSMEEELPPLTKFILPGVTLIDSYAHACRTQTRKVERLFVELCLVEEWECVHADMMGSYLNRLSDFFFVLARWICHSSGESDCFYTM